MMNTTRAVTGALLLCLGCGGAAANTTTAGGGALFPSAFGTVRLEAFPPTLRGGQPVREIIVRLDGSEIVRCQDGALHRCEEPADILAGAHRVELVLLSDLGIDPDVLDLPLTLAGGELVVIDVAHGSMRREGGAPAASGDCASLLGQLTAASSACSAAQLEQAIQLAEAASGSCASYSGDAAQVAIAQIVGTFTATGSDACYSRAELALLPPVFSSSYYEDEGGRTSLSGFAWMHATVRLRELQGRPLPEVLRALREAFIQARPRFEVGNAIARAYIDYPAIEPLFALAQRYPFTLDPDEPGGRILFTLLLSNLVMSPRTTPQARAAFASFSSWVAEHVANDTTAHCDQWPTAESLSSFFAADDFISREEWHAADRMLDRTPAGSYVARCNPTWRNIPSDVSHADRTALVARVAPDGRRR